MNDNRMQTAVRKAKEYIDSLTIDSEQNIPRNVVANEKQFFTWDNEKRNPAEKPYLFDWSYYNGVVMEGLFDVFLAEPDKGEAYFAYVKEYLDSMIVTDEEGNPSLSRNLAGYVDYHGADCYKTAALLMKITNGADVYMRIASDLYRDLTDPSYQNSKGDIVSRAYTEETLGGNYWHSWAGKKPPKYKVWLDGIYMLQPFIAHYAAMVGDDRQLEAVQKRLNWVADTMLAPNGMYYHACSSRNEVCPYHWLRAMGWYAMAMVDVMEVLPEEYMEERKRALKLFVDGMLAWQHTDGMWANLADRPVTETNRPETSGTAMMVYTILKGVRKGWLEESYREPALKAFAAITETKLTAGGLQDIYLKASANNTNNYEITEYYLPDEGKGSGPFIMAYSEMLYVMKG